MDDKAHLRMEGLHKIIRIKSTLNLGLSEKLKTSFPDIKPVERSIFIPTTILDFYWISGFISGDGNWNFFVDIFKSNSNKIGFQVKLRLSITQHIRDKELLTLIINYLKAGIINIHSENILVLKITKFDDITNNIIPLLEQNPIQGVKYLDFLDFCKVAKLMDEKKHLTPEGLDIIKRIKNKMNTKRKIN